MATRIQLTLLVPEGAAIAIEEVRRVLDPVQSRLIPAHVTLCREDEFEDTAELRDRLTQAPPEAIELAFGRAEAFDGHGLLLPCIGGMDAFQALRASVLGSPSIRPSKPHITLAHPRNPRAVGNTGVHGASQLPAPLPIRFDTLSLIRQTGGSVWQTLWSVPLRRGW